jgi:hypothetical protein
VCFGKFGNRQREGKLAKAGAVIGFHPRASTWKVRREREIREEKRGRGGIHLESLDSAKNKRIDIFLGLICRGIEGTFD